MKSPVSVDKAIIRGHLMVNLPVFITMFGIPALAYYLKKQGLIPGWGIGVAAILGFVLAWLVWSFMITKWRIWAFENVRNVHELKQRAIDENLIWPDGFIFERTEIRTKADKLKLQQLEEKFLFEDEYKEDLGLPSKTEIFYAKSDLYFEAAAMLLVLGGAIYFLLPDGEEKKTKIIVLSIIFILIAVIDLIKLWPKLKQHQPQIIIDSYGIQTAATGFIEWQNIFNERVHRNGIGIFGAEASFSFDYYDEAYEDYLYEKIDLEGLDVSADEMENILRTYRIRYQRMKY